MVFNFLTKVFGSKNERELNRIKPNVEMINKLEGLVKNIFCGINRYSVKMNLVMKM